MEYLQRNNLILSETEDEDLRHFLQNSIQGFYEELDNFCIKNDNYDFGEWFSERSFLSMYLNALIRNDKGNNITVVQEFCVPEGRCDALVTDKRTIFLIESKMERYKRSVNDQHFDIDLWIEFDETKIRNQLRYYYDIEKKFYTDYGRYNSKYLMTLAFKMIKEEKDNHFKKAQEKLDTRHQNKYERFWFYSAAFIKDSLDGIEVYGTVEKANDSIIPVHVISNQKSPLNESKNND